MPPINTRDRKELGTLLQSLAAGDQVLATRIDRLARSMFELFAIVKTIIDAGDNFSTREMTLEHFHLVCSVLGAKKEAFAIGAGNRVEGTIGRPKQFFFRPGSVAAHGLFDLAPHGLNGIEVR